MNLDLLIEGCAEIGCCLIRCGAEIHRVEDTVRRILRAYHVTGDVYAIPTHLIISTTDTNGTLMTRMRRAETGATDMDALARYNALSRQICAAPPKDTGMILKMAEETKKSLRPGFSWVYLLGCFISAVFFALFFQGTPLEALVAGVSGLAAGVCMVLLNCTKSNFFINTIFSAFALTLVSCGSLMVGLPIRLAQVIAGGMMVLVPGLICSSFMSNLLSGDIVSGVSIFVKALLTAVAIALGSGACYGLFFNLIPSSDVAVSPAAWSPIMVCLFAGMASLGFCLTFNIRKAADITLCCLGGGLGWAAYLLATYFGGTVYISSFIASIVITVYADFMAHLCKSPMTSYLLVSYVPLVPGFTLYKAMEYGTNGDSAMFLETFLLTVGITGCISIGTLFISTIMRIIRERNSRKKMMQ